MIDMHSHCLPGIDDGAKNVDDAIIMLEDVFNKGIKKVFATPHCRVYSEEELISAVEARERAYSALIGEAEARKTKIPVIKKGFEVYLDKDITAFPSYRSLCMEDTDVMLVEMPVSYWDSFAIGRIKSLKNAGITPLIAHVERYLGFKKIIQNILSEQGIIYQINADAFFGWRRMKLIKKLWKMGKTVVVGSDMHNMTSRKNRLAEAYKKAIKKNKSYEIMFDKDISALLL